MVQRQGMMRVLAGCLQMLLPLSAAWAAVSVVDDATRFPQLNAVAHGNLLTIDDSVMNRSGPRILDGVEELCKQLDCVRGRH